MIPHQMRGQIVPRFFQGAIIKIDRLPINAFTSLKDQCSFRISPRFERFLPVYRKLSGSALYGAFPLTHDTPHITEPQEKAQGDTDDRDQ